VVHRGVAAQIAEAAAGEEGAGEKGQDEVGGHENDTSNRSAVLAEDKADMEAQNIAEDSDAEEGVLCKVLALAREYILASGDSLQELAQPRAGGHTS
jgi:hypothetical protein